MKSITILTNTMVKAIVTDSLRESTRKAIIAKRKELEHQIEQVKLQKQYFAVKLKNDAEQLQKALLKFDKMEQDISAKLAQYQGRLQQIFQWENGQEVMQAQVQSLVEISEGDLFTKAVSKEIIIQDGVVVKIRKTGGLNFE